MWVGRDKKLTSRTQMQQSHIPCLAKMMQNKCFLSLQMLQTTTNSLIAPRVSLLKSVWIFGVLIHVMLCFGVKRCFCNRRDRGGLRRVTET